MDSTRPNNTFFVGPYHIGHDLWQSSVLTIDVNKLLFFIFRHEAVAWQYILRYRTRNILTELSTLLRLVEYIFMRSYIELVEWTNYYFFLDEAKASSA